jgi:hypothetical protein
MHTSIFIHSKIHRHIHTYIDALTYTIHTKTYFCSGVNPPGEQLHDTNPNPLHLLQVHLSNIFPFFLSIPTDQPIRGGVKKIEKKKNIQG